MSNDTLISAKNISYSYSTTFRTSAQKYSVDHISFELKRGEILAFLGPNGAGKSTTMRLLTGNLTHQSGNIFIAKYNLQKQAQLAKSCIGYLPDTPPLYKELRVDEYLIFCAQIHNLSSHQIPKSLAYVKQRCGLLKYGRQIIAKLSKGIQQRIGIAQAIIHQPDIIILDEPSNGLDPVQRHDILTLIKELGETHSVLISTHSWADVQQAACNKVQIINKGKLVYQDSIESLQQKLNANQLNVRFDLNLGLNLGLNNEAKQNEIITQLSNVQGVEDIHVVDKINSLCLKVQCHESMNTEQIKQITKTIIGLFSSQQWGLYEINRDKKSFDEVFLSLTE